MEVLCRVCTKQKHPFDRVRKALEIPTAGQTVDRLSLPPRNRPWGTLQHVSWFAFHCCDKYHDQRQCGKQGIIVYGLQTIIQGTQGRK